MELGCLKTIAGFLNSRNGGTLLIGVMDNGTPVGIEADGFLNEDKMLLHLDNLIRERIGPKHVMYIHPHFEDYDGCKVLAVECSPSGSPVFVKDGPVERFYIRMGASTPELTSSQTHEYIKERFG
jgi:predicted HTH transcriptional regulator